MNPRQPFRSRRPQSDGEFALQIDDGAVPTLRPRAGAPTAAPRTARAWRQPLPILGAVLALVALLGYWSVYSRSTQRTPVLVAARNLPAGTVLRDGDLHTAKIAASGALLATLVPQGDLARAAGHRLASAVAAGAPLPRAAVAARVAGPASLTLAVPLLHALGGALAPGDRVTVLATFANSTGQAQTRAVARNLEVLAVGQPSNALDPNSQTIPVTLALPDPSLASALALAGAEAKIDLLREGGRSSAPIASASEGGR